VPLAIHIHHVVLSTNRFFSSFPASPPPPSFPLRPLLLRVLRQSNKNGRVFRAALAICVRNDLHFTSMQRSSTRGGKMHGMCQGILGSYCKWKTGSRSGTQGSRTYARQRRPYQPWGAITQDGKKEGERIGEREKKNDKYRLYRLTTSED